MGKHDARLDALNYYAATRKYDLQFPRLTDHVEVEAVVIGGGFTGINTALDLAERGVTDVAVLEARHLGYGGSGRNGGQIMVGIGHDLEYVARHVGTDGMRVITELAGAGAKAIRERVERYGIDADLHRGYGYLGVNRRQAKTLRLMAEQFRQIDPDETIEYFQGAEVRDIIGSDAYCAAIKHDGGGHVHSLNLLLGEAKAAAGLGVQVFENSPVIDVAYGDTITVRTNSGSVRARKVLWACDSFLRKLEPEIHPKTINTYSFQVATEPLSDELCLRISPFRGAYSDISSVINYYRVTTENRLLFGSATRLIEYMPRDFEAWNRNLLKQVFPYLADVKIDYSWGGPMACSANLFPQVGTLNGRPNAFYAQGYSGFGVTPSHIVCKVLADGMSSGSERWDVMRSIPHVSIPAKDALRSLIMTGAKTFHYLRCLAGGR